MCKKCERLSSFKANVLRTKTLGTVEWEKKDGKWEGGVKEGQGWKKVEVE
jgi:beta-lactamase superfamily II metal-dependent hydrolase